MTRTSVAAAAATHSLFGNSHDTYTLFNHSYVLETLITATSAPLDNS